MSGHPPGPRVARGLARVHDPKRPRPTIPTRRRAGLSRPRPRLPGGDAPPRRAQRRAGRDPGPRGAERRHLAAPRRSSSTATPRWPSPRWRWRSGASTRRPATASTSGRRHVEDDRGRRGGRRLARRRLGAVLPGDVGRPDGRRPPPAVRARGPRARRAVRRGLRRPGRGGAGGRRGGARTRCSPSSSAAAAARCATSSPRSRPSRTR